MLDPRPDKVRRLLIVEDSPEQRMFYQEVLAQQKDIRFSCVEAELGEEGLELYRQEMPDCILLDYRLPDMDGLEFLEELGGGRGRVPVPVIMLTSQGDERVAVQAIKKGAFDYLTKQKVDPDLLAITIERAVRHKQEEQFRTLVESAPDAMVVVNAAGHIMLVNAQTERIFGYGRAELLGTSMDRLLDGADRRIYAEHRTLYFEGEEQSPAATRLELYGRRADGSRFPIEVSLSPMQAGETILVSSAIRDITERKAAEVALRKSEARNRALLNAIPDAMVHLSKDGTYLDIQLPKSYTPFVNPDTLLGSSAFEVLPTAFAEEAKACMQRALETGELQQFEYEVEIRGERHIREARIVAVNENEVISIQRDITQRKRAEEGLRESERRFRELFEASPDAVFVENRDGVILDANPAASRLLRIDRADLIGISAFDLVPPSQQQRARQVFGELAAGTRDYEEGYSWAVTGQAIPVEIRSSRITYDGTPALLLHVRDVTQRKAAETALRKSEAMLRTIVTNIPVILFALNHEGVFTLAEGKGMEPFDVQPGKAVGHSAFAIFRRRADIQADLRRALAGEPFSTMIDVQGRALECWYAPLVDARGNTEGVIGVAADITELVRSKEEVAQSREALRGLTARLQEVREEERTRLSREVHDVLGQAMTALRMDVMWLERGLPEEPASNHDRIADMKAQIDETIQTIRRIASDLRPGILDDLGVAAAIEWQAQRFQARTDIACVARVPYDELNLDTPRATALFRIFQEILTNVARHAQATRVDILLQADPGILTLRVQDNGRGIREDDLRQTKSLGLLGMRERVLPWAGEVRFEGNPGAGTTVTVTLPYSTSAFANETPLL